MEYTSIYGIIKIDREYHKSVEYLKNLKEEPSYPSINSSMFSFGDFDYHYENMVLGFAVTYKYFGLENKDWNVFILKIENILRNIDFENAQFHCESAIGDYTLFWTKQGALHCGEENEKKYLNKYKLTKTNEWYFGFGRRSVSSGRLIDIKFYGDLRNENLGFIYPVK